MVKYSNFGNQCSLLLVFLVSLASCQVNVDQCTNPAATLYDGHLDNFLYYASFSGELNSYLKFRNPFAGL